MKRLNPEEITILRTTIGILNETGHKHLTFELQRLLDNNDECYDPENDELLLISPDERRALEEQDLVLRAAAPTGLVDQLATIASLQDDTEDYADLRKKQPWLRSTLPSDEDLVLITPEEQRQIDERREMIRHLQTSK